MSTKTALDKIQATLDALPAGGNSPVLTTIASDVVLIKNDLGIGTGTTPTTTTSAVTGINLPDSTTTSAVGAGLFTAGTFLIDGITVTVGASDTLATIASNAQAALVAAGKSKATATVSGAPGSFMLTVIDNSTGSGAGFTGPAVAGLTISAPVFS